MATPSKQTSTTSMIIDGVAASEAIDSSGEILDVKGCDTSDFENGVGLLNYEHRGDQAQGASGNDIVGKIIYSKKIYKKDDCEGKRQEAYWDHVKLPFIYIKARLYDGAEHPGALALAAAIRDAVMHAEPILLRFSIEGTTLKKEGNRLLRTIGRKVALTFKPANKSAISGLISDPSGPKPISEKQGEKSLLSRLLEDDTSKSEAPGQQHLGSYEMSYNPIVEEDVVGLLKSAADKIRDMRLDTYEWHPVTYDFLSPAPLAKGADDFDQSYTPIEFSLGSNKLRQLRDWLIAHRMKKVNENDERLPTPIKQALLHTGRDYEGNFSVERIQKLIDEKPKLKFNAGTGTYDYIQRHSAEPSQVFQLHLTNEQAKKLNDLGVMGSFSNMHEISKLSKHPVLPGTIGWVRFTGNKRGIHIDEVQSDYGRKWSALIDHQLGEAVSQGKMSAEQAASMRLDLTAKLPDEHLKIIQKTLFGNKHPAEVLHEAFHQWARTNGLAGAPVHIWSPKAKAALNGMDPTQPLPGHYNVTYKDVPEKMGMTPGQYGDIPTQKNPDLIKPKEIGVVGEDVDWKGEPSTFKDKIRKSEELAKTLEGGMPTGAPSTLTQGAALQREDSRLHQHDFKNKLRCAIRDMGVEVVGKAAMLKFFKWQLPEVNETFLDHFTDLVADIKARPAVLDSLMAKWELPMAKAEEGEPTEAPATEAKPEKPKKPRATRPPKEKPPLPMPVEQFKPTPEGVNPQESPPVGRSKKGLVGGVLYTPMIPAGLPLHNFAADPVMLSILHADDPSKSPTLTPEQREHILTYVHRPWERAMTSWKALNNMAKEGMLPPSVIAHAAIFAAMSPNTSVPIQELYYGHYMDFRRQHPDVFTNPQGISPEDAIAFHRHLNSVEPPEFFNSYYTQGPGKMKYGAERLATRVSDTSKAGIKRAGAQLVDRPQGLPLINYHKAHPILTALHKVTKDDARSFVDYMMQQKSVHGAGAFMYGFGPKLARYMSLMLGMGNAIVPDRHMMRSLFNLSLAQKPEFDAVQRTLAPMEGEPILRAIDKHFLENNPAVKKVQDHYADHFIHRPEQAVGPAFWLHWLAYPQYEAHLGRPTENANAGTAHDPYWQSIVQIMNEEGIPHDLPASDEPWMKKSQDTVGIPERVARATKKVQDQFGESPASFFYYAYGVPALMHNHIMDQISGQDVRKAEYEAIERASLMKREYCEIETAKLCKALDLEGKDEVYSVDGDTQHGRFWVNDGKIRILEDHEGVLRRYLHNGSVEDNRAGIGQLVMEGHRVKAEAPVAEGKEIDLGKPAEDQIQPGDAPEGIEDPHMDDAPESINDMAADFHRPSPIFDLMIAGAKKPTVVEIRGDTVYENGQKLEQEDADYLLHLVRTGRATLRYHQEEFDKSIAKLTTTFIDLAKTAPEVRQAMTGLHAAAKAGHIDPKHADAIRRGLFTDRLTGGRIGNQAAHEDFIEGLKGKKNPGVHVHIDANDFGSINKMHGMPTGDAAIKTLANTMRETIDKHIGRKNAKLFRVGGDEFKAHFQTPAHAAVFARALRHNLDQTVPVGGTHRLSTSIGMGHTPEHAEQALMNAKNEKKAQNYPLGQAEHHAHSLLPGHEGAVPLETSSVPKLHLQPR